MGSFSDYWETATLRHMFNKQDYTQPADYAIGLYTAAPSDAGGGTEVTEPSYVRKTCTAFGLSGSIIYNSGAITFAQATSTWGTISHFGIFDTATGGNLLAWGTCTTSKDVNTNDTAEFADKALTVSLD
jgi:hypothetical protein